MTKSVYYINTSLGDVTATWDTSKGINWKVTFVIIDATNNFIITTNSSPVTESISGDALPFTTGLLQYEAIQVHYNGTNLYIH
jgi:hypothetical protein